MAAAATSLKPAEVIALPGVKPLVCAARLKTGGVRYSDFVIDPQNADAVRAAAKRSGKRDSLAWYCRAVLASREIERIVTETELKATPMALSPAEAAKYRDIRSFGTRQPDVVELSDGEPPSSSAVVALRVDPRGHLSTKEPRSKGGLSSEAPAVEQHVASSAAPDLADRVIFINWALLRRRFGNWLAPLRPAAGYGRCFWVLLAACPSFVTAYVINWLAAVVSTARNELGFGNYTAANATSDALGAVGTVVGAASDQVLAQVKGEQTSGIGVGLVAFMAFVFGRRGPH